MTPRSEIEARFAEAHSRLNAHRRQLVQAILESPGETFFLSSRQLAQRYQVDPATIVRTIQALGYERFADFAAELRQHFVSRLTPYTIMEASARAKGTVADQVTHVLERDHENLETLRSALDMPKIVDLAKQIHQSKKILVVGVDLAFTLSAFLAYGLLLLGFDAEAPAGSSGNLYHKIRTLTNKDLVIGISFGRCLKDTVDALVRARERGVPTFGITDSETTPVARHTDDCVCVSIASTAFAGSYVAPMALFNAILVTCAHVKPKRSLALLRQSEAEYRSSPRWYDESADLNRLPPPRAIRPRRAAPRRATDRA